MVDADGPHEVGPARGTGGGPMRRRLVAAVASAFLVVLVVGGWQVVGGRSAEAGTAPAAKLVRPALLTRP